MNSTDNANCTVRFKNGSCNRGEKMHFRFWPGNGNPTHTSQGLMALIVMLVLLALVIIYCCWGSCCKMVQRRRRRRANNRVASNCDSGDESFAAQTHVWVPPSDVDFIGPPGRRSRSNREFVPAYKPRAWERTVLPMPPPYDALFGSDIGTPPTYSSLTLDQSLARPAQVATAVTVEPHAAELLEPVVASSTNAHEVGRVLRSQSVPASIGSAALSLAPVGHRET